MGERWPERPGGRQRDETTSWKVVASPRTGTSERVWQSKVPVEPATVAGRRGDPRPVSGYANGAYPGTYRLDPDRTSYQPTYRPADEPGGGEYDSGYGSGGGYDSGYGSGGGYSGYSGQGYGDQGGGYSRAVSQPVHPGYQDQAAYPAPAYEPAGYPPPGYRTPGYQTPGNEAPGYPPPGYETPGYETRGYDAPPYPTSPVPAPPTSAPAARPGADGPPRTYSRATGSIPRQPAADDDAAEAPSRRRSPRPRRGGLPEPAAAWPPVMAWTVGSFVVPLLLFLGWAWTRSGEVPATCLDLGEPCSAPRAAALSTFVDVLPGVAAAIALSLLAALGLRRLSETWRPVTVGLGGAIIGAGFATLLTSAFS